MFYQFFIQYPFKTSFYKHFQMQMFGNISEQEMWIDEIAWDVLYSISSTTGISWHITCMCLLWSHRYENCSCLCVSLLIALAGVACAWWRLLLSSSEMVSWHLPAVSNCFFPAEAYLQSVLSKKLADASVATERCPGNRLVVFAAANLKQLFVKNMSRMLGDFTNHVRKPIHVDTSDHDTYCR